MGKFKIQIFFLIFLVVFSLDAYAISDYLWAYSTWFSSAAIDAAREATPVLKMSEEQEAIYRLGFAAGYDSAKSTENITVLLDEGNGIADASARLIIPDVTSDNETISYVINTETNKFHIPGCYAEKKILPEHRKIVYGTFEEIRQMGYSPCGICFKNSK